MTDMDKKASISPLIWLGAKRLHLEKILSYFPEHRTFCDVFGGGGSVILGKRPSPIDVYNDLDGRLANFFRVLSDEKKMKELQKRLRNTLYSRKVWEEAKEMQNSDLDDLVRAYCFFVVNRQSFAGLGESWGYDVAGLSNGEYARPVMNFHSAIERLEKTHKFLRKIQVENLDFRNLIKRYDREETLFYLDPPYDLNSRSTAKSYDFDFSDSDHKDLVNLLLNIKGMVLLSGYETEIYNPLLEAGWFFDKFTARVKSTNGRNKTARKVTKECLWISPSCLKNKPQNKLFLE